MIMTAMERGNMPLAAQLLEQAAKESGGAYTNKHQHELTGKDRKDLPAAPAAQVTIFALPTTAEDSAAAVSVRIGPQPGPQQLFLSSAADIAIYGGAAGGVYVEDVKALTDEIVALIRVRTEHVPEGPSKGDHRAPLITAAQEIDGFSLPVLWKRGGITGMIRHIADEWTRCGSSN